MESHKNLRNQSIANAKNELRMKTEMFRVIKIFLGNFDKGLYTEYRLAQVLFDHEEINSSWKHVPSNKVIPISVPGT